ncbi:MAG: serine/threonine protein kinase, partial [Thermoanaerobaculia bacterium]
NGPMPARLVIEIAIQALIGLDHLHSMGLIHRDVSPENIMLSQERGGKLLVKVIDFGIAKQLTEGEGGQGLTQTGMFLGKLKYASPEQAGFLKEHEHIDARSDLYSFGIVMYEMLAGRAPFQATNPHGYILKHVTEKPAPIGVISPGISVPPQLEAIIFKSLEKDRNDRFASAAEFASALEAIRDSVAPDSKYGVGERMVTLSSEKTLADISARGTITPFGKQTTQGTGPRTTAGTKSAGDQATVIERGTGPRTVAGTGTPGMQATVSERAGANEATVMERVGGAAPTVSEKKFGATTAEPTVMERKVGVAPRPAKSNTAKIAAIAAVVVLVLGIGGYFAFFAPHAGKTDIVTKTDTGVKVDTTVTQPPIPVPPAGQGVLLLSASPWADIEKIVSAGDNKVVDLSEEKRSTPTSIELAPGKYFVTVKGPNEQQTTVDVVIKAGEPTKKVLSTGAVDWDQLQRDMDLQKESKPK